MTCNLSQIRKQLDDMQMLVDAHVACHKNDGAKLLDRCPKEAIEIIIEQTKQACIYAVEKCDFDFINRLNGTTDTCVQLDDAVEAIRNVK